MFLTKMNKVSAGLTVGTFFLSLASVLFAVATITSPMSLFYDIYSVFLALFDLWLLTTVYFSPSSWKS
jgi:hypothetical protein